MIIAELIAAGLYALWIAFLAIMNLQRAHLAGTLGPVAFGFAVPLLFAGYVLDVAVNLTLATLVFWDTPKEWTLSERLTRLIREGTDRRQRMARAVLRTFCEPFDTTGQHNSR